MVKRVKVLLAEDNLVVGADFSELLSEQRYQVVGPYKQLYQAVRAYEKDRPHIALMEMRMQGGQRTHHFARRILSDGRCVIFLTAGLADDQATLAGLPGAKALEKPVNPRQLMELLQECVSAGRGR